MKHTPRLSSFTKDQFASPIKSIRKDRIVSRIKNLLVAERREEQQLPASRFPMRWNGEMLDCSEHLLIGSASRLAKDVDYLERMELLAVLPLSASLDAPELCPRCGADRYQVGFVLHLSDQYGNVQTIHLDTPDQLGMLVSFFCGFNWYDDSLFHFRFPLQDAVLTLCKLFGVQPKMLGIILQQENA
jgi:hypothetical protein